MKKKIIHFIKALDFAQVDLGFKIKKKEKYSTFLGGIIFIIYIIFTSYFIISYFIAFISRSNFNQNSIEYDLDYGSKLDVFDKKIAFSFGLLLNDKSDNILSKYFNISVKYVSIFKGNNTKIKESLPLIKCTKKDFTNAVDKDFDLLQLNQFDCIDKEQLNRTHLYLEGIFTSEVYSYLEYSVFSLPFAKEYLKEFMDLFYNNDIKLQLYHLESSLRILNYDSPEELYINTQYIALSYPFVLKYNLDLINNTFVNDANILLPAESVFNYYTPIKQDTMYIFLGNTRFDDEFNDSDLFGRIFIRASPKTFQIKRVYQKFTEFLADSTSIASQLLIILMFFIGIYDEFRAEECIIDNVLRYQAKIIKKIPNEFQKMKYLFDPQTMDKREINKEEVRYTVLSKNITTSNQRQPIFQCETQNPSRQTNLITSNVLQLNDNANNEYSDITKQQQKPYLLSRRPLPRKNINQHRPSSIGPFLSSELKTIGLKKTKTDNVLYETTMKHSLCDLIKICFLKIGINSNIKAKSILFDKGMEYFLYNLDIFTYFTKMREIDLIKYFLFNMNEICLIDFLAKPSISNVIPDENSPIRCMKNEFNITAENIQKVSEAFSLMGQLYHDHPNDEKLVKFLKQTSYEIYQLIH